MQLSWIKLNDFRNYEDAFFTFHDGANILCGQNAQGKTNLLEAIAAISTMKLFRTHQKKEAIRFHQEQCSIEAGFLAQQREMNMKLQFFQHKSLEIHKNGVRQKRQIDAAGTLQTVLFCPDDLYLVREGAAARRRFIDAALCQLRPNYAQALTQYQRLLEHKTRILRDSEEKPSLLQLLDDFSLRMAQYGAHIIQRRARFIKALAQKTAMIHAEIAGKAEQLTLTYHTVSTIEDPFASVDVLTQALYTHAQAHRSAEISTKSCLSGAHKDDMFIAIDGKAAANFASQGQVRTCALSLKLAERDLFFEDSGEYPILLLDDVLSELDSTRQDFVLNRIRGGQVFITCCEQTIADKIGDGKIFYLENGKSVESFS